MCLKGGEGVDAPVVVCAQSRSSREEAIQDGSLLGWPRDMVGRSRRCSFYLLSLRGSERRSRVIGWSGLDCCVEVGNKVDV